MPAYFADDTVIWQSSPTVFWFKDETLDSVVLPENFRALFCDNARRIFTLDNTRRPLETDNARRFFVLAERHHLIIDNQRRAITPR